MLKIDQKIILRTLCSKDKETLYKWATNADSTPYWYGSLYGNETPTKEEFFKDYNDQYFDQKKASEKGAFAIKLFPDDREIGVINYQVEWVYSNKFYDIDILIASDCDKCKGHGSASISTLFYKLNNEYLAENFLIHAHSENLIAQKSDKKAGFLINGKYKDPLGIEWFEYRKRI